MKTRFSSAQVLGFVGVVALALTACKGDGGGKAPVPPGHDMFELCQQCHGPSAGGNTLANAPSIAGMPAWYIENQLKKFKAGGRGTHFDDLTGMQMRPMAMSLANDEEIAAVAKYVSEMPVQAPAATDAMKGDASKGQALYTPCVACHGADGSGNQQLNAPPLTHTNDWYLVRSLEKFKSGVRGSNPTDITGAGMRPMAATLADEQAMKDVVAYILTLKK